MSISLWDWSVAAYGAPGVAETCLELQDTAGQNTCLLLWAAWTAETGRDLDAETLEAGCDAARAWDEAAVAPLRAIRRGLKTRRLDMDDTAREAIRARVKALELEAERYLLDALEALAPQAEPRGARSSDALAAAARAWGGIVPRQGLQTLAQRLSARH